MIPGLERGHPRTKSILKEVPKLVFMANSGRASEVPNFHRKLFLKRPICTLTASYETNPTTAHTMVVA